jgi:uncharacterized protein (UPF0548 family)
VAIHLRRPGHEHLQGLLASARSAALTYECVGASLDPQRPTPGLTRRQWHARVGPPEVFDAAVDAAVSWQVQRGAGIAVLPDAPLAVGTTVAMAAPLPIGFVDATCRVVEIVREADRFGFAYGTLPVHPECGEESFLLERDSDGTTFTIVAVSRVVDRLGRLAPPIANRLQAQATDRYLDALRRAVS